MLLYKGYRKSGGEMLRRGNVVGKKAQLKNGICAAFIRKIIQHEFTQGREG